jgi:hypothetical protein
MTAIRAHRGNFPIRKKTMCRQGLRNEIPAARQLALSCRPFLAPPDGLPTTKSKPKNMKNRTTLCGLEKEILGGFQIHDLGKERW